MFFLLLYQLDNFDDLTVFDDFADDFDDLTDFDDFADFDDFESKLPDRINNAALQLDFDLTDFDD
jgi:hypothetical protein